MSVEGRPGTPVHRVSTSLYMFSAAEDKRIYKRREGKTHKKGRQSKSSPVKSDRYTRQNTETKNLSINK